MHFPSDVRHDSQKRPFLALKDKTTKYGTPDSISYAFKERPCSKGEKVKMNKGNPTQNGVRMPWRESSHALSFITASTAQRKKKDFSLSLATASCSHVQPMRCQHYFKLSFSNNDLLFETIPPNFLLSSIKRCSPLFSRLTFGSLKLQFLCYSWINSFALQ